MLNDVLFVGKFMILFARNNYKCKNEKKKYDTIILLSLACRGQLNNEISPIFASNIKNSILKHKMRMIKYIALLNFSFSG